MQTNGNAIHQCGAFQAWIRIELVLQNQLSQLAKKNKLKLMKNTQKL